MGADVEQLAQTRPGQAVAAHGMLVVSSRNAVARSVGQDARQARGSEGRVARISRRQAADGRGCQLPGIQSLRGGLGRDAGGWVPRARLRGSKTTPKQRRPRRSYTGTMELAGREGQRGRGCRGVLRGAAVGRDCELSRGTALRVLNLGQRGAGVC